MEWKSSFNPFNSLKVLTWPKQIEAILNCMNNNAGKFEPPVSVTVDPTTSCNFNCMWCIAADFLKSAPNKSLSRQLLIDMAHFFKHWGVQSICIAGGGEPFLNPATSEFIRTLDKSIQVGVITNGSVLSSNNGEIIGTLAGSTRWVGFSMDSGTPETHSKVHNCSVSASEQAYKNMKKLVNEKRGRYPDIGYKFLIHPLNYKEIYQAAKLAKGIGCRDFHARPVFLKDHSVFNNEIINESNLQIEAARNDLDCEGFKVFGIMHKYDDNWKRKIGFKKCRATPLATVFSADSNIWVCCDRRGEDNMNLGSFNPLTNVEGLWGSNFHKELINKIEPTNCPRCTFGMYNTAIEKVFISDEMTRKFI